MDPAIAKQAESPSPGTTPASTQPQPAAGGEAPQTERPRHFIQQLIDEHIAQGRWGTPGDRTVVTTRFPPEPNGYLHVGHAKSICVNFGLALEYGGRAYLRFDDTNPTKEDQEYVDSIIDTVRWLGFRWVGADASASAAVDAGVRYASDYFDRMHAWAVELIEKGLAYVDDQSAEQMRATRGNLTEPGVNSPFRDRSVAENLDLFARMTAGEFAEGTRVLRAKIDMASPNMNLRDPVMYRIQHAEHHRTGGRWCVYPMYDWAHGFEDSIEGITNSICTLEFESHRPLYDWFIASVNQGRGAGSRWGMPIHHPQQTEFARLNPSYIITSKRKLKQLVDERHVESWDDPRMPTLAGFRRRGYTPEGIRAFCDGVGVTKFNGVHDIGLLEGAVRDDLNRRAPRRMCVLRPLKVTIATWGAHGDADRTEWLQAVNNPENDAAGQRAVAFSRELYIDRDDFMEQAPKDFFRLKPGGEVRLRYGYWITCTEVVKHNGEVVELICTHDPATRGGDSPPPGPDGKVRKVKGTIHWVSARESIACTVRLFDRLFTVESPDRKPKDAPESWSFLEQVNPASLEVLDGCRIEANWMPTDGELAAFRAGELVVGRDPDDAWHLKYGPSRLWSDGIERFQFERQGYFCRDIGASARGSHGRRADTAASPLVFNRTVSLKDSWAKAKG